MNWLRLNANSRKRMTSILLILLTVYIFVIPLLNLGIKAFRSEGSITLLHFANVFSDSSFYEVIFNTIFINVISTFFAGLIGIFFAYIVAYTDIKHKTIINTLLLMPIVIPSYITTLAWMQFTSPNGLLSSIIGYFNIYSYGGIILVFSLVNYPIAYLLTLNSFKKINPDMELAANLAGSSRIKTFLKITLPMSSAGIINGLLLVFLACLDNFGTVAFLGIPANITVLSTDIYQSVISFSDDNMSKAAVKSIVLVFIALTVLLLVRFVNKRFQSFQVEKLNNEPRIHLEKWTIPVNILVYGLLIVINFLPLTIMISSSLKSAIGVNLTFDTFTLKNYEFVFSNFKTINAIQNSLFLGVVTLIICSVVGTGLAYYSVRKPTLQSGFLQSIVTIPYSLPGIIIGLALILQFLKPLPIINFSLYGTIWILLIAYVVRFTAVQLNSTRTGFLELDISMEEAASIAGASNRIKWVKIILPLTSAAVLSGAGMVFINAFTELTTSSLLWSAGSETIGVLIHNFTSAGQTAIASAFSTIVMIVIFILYFATVLLIKFVRKVRER